jgi:hypothetical protein
MIGWLEKYRRWRRVKSRGFKAAQQQVLVLNHSSRPSLTMPLGPLPLKSSL